MHIFLDLLYVERSSKTSCWYLLLRKFNWFVFFNSLIIYDNWYTDIDTYK